MLNVTIDRNLWLRGEGDRGSCLLAPDGRMCCLGFACLAAGETKEAIHGLPDLETLAGCLDDISPALHLLVRDEPAALVNSELGIDLMKTNDDPSLSPAARESEIVRLGLEAGINFTFEGPAR